MIKIDRLDHLVLTVKDIDKTVEFYTIVLGMEKELFKGDRVALKFGNQKINLHKLGSEFEPKAYNVKEGSADLSMPPLRHRRWRPVRATRPPGRSGGCAGRA